MKKPIWRSMTIGLLALTFCVGGYAARDVVAMGAVPNSDIDKSALEVNDLSKVSEVKTSEQQKRAKSSDDVVRELMEAYKQKNNITEGYNVGASKNFASSIRMVGVNTASPDFGKARVLAFDQAYNAALKDFVKSQNNQIVSETVSSLFQNNSTKAREFSEELAKGKSTMGAMLDKLVAVGDAMASDKLRQYGIDPEQYNAAPPDRKKILLSECFVKRTTERSSMTLGGITPIQTFIGEDGNGNQSVGVILMYSPKLQAVAQALRLGQKPAIVNAGPPLQESIPLNDSAKLYDLLGVRVLFDQHGLVVVSYGQWSNSYSGSDPKLRSRYSSTAFSQAESLANAQISEFLNTSFSSEDQQQIGEAMEQAVIKEGRGGKIVEPETATNIIDIRKEYAKRKTSARLQGASTLKKWTFITPEGHEIVGVIKTYSFANIEGATSTPAGTGGTITPGQPKGRTGQDQMNINTF